MYYEYKGCNYNLSFVTKIKSMKCCFRYGYRYTKEEIPAKYFLGIFKTRNAQPVGYYLEDWYDGTFLQVEKETALYSDGSIRIWFSDSDYGKDWELNTEEEALKLIELCKQASIACKFK